MPQAAQLSTQAAFTQYLHVINRSLGENRDQTPYKQILDASEKLFDESTVAVGVYKDKIDQPHDWFVVEFDDGTFSLEKHGKGEADLEWRIRQSHVEEVVDNPEEYVEHPYKLDLDWLKKTLSVTA